MSMKELEGTELVLRISGAVEQSNLKEFEEQALAVIEAINTDLNTDEDFFTAEANIKGCQLMENRIATARSTALTNTEAIAALIQTTERLEAKFRETRLLLNGKVKTEKARRVAEIVNSAISVLEKIVSTSPVKHGFVIDREAIKTAVRGKKSIAKMQEAVNAVVEAEKLGLSNVEEVFLQNIDKLNSAEMDWPGLFPDRQSIALHAPETVEAMIVARIADHRLKMAEKARREAEEAERKAKIAEAERIAMESEHLAEIAPAASGVIVDDPREYVPIPNPFVDFPIPPPVGVTEYYDLLVAVNTGDINSVLEAIRKIPGVDSVMIDV
ncbi:TPA: hypothetical protein DCS99_03625 [Candidatus Wolfebacteria bacterium]|nr:hypothetical protein [Candidatus Wolfebacteria bacterium]